MCKSTIVGSNMVILATLIVAGCQVIVSGPSEEELIKTTMADWKAALIDKDLDKLMALYSEDYACASYDSKSALRAYIAAGFQHGYTDNVKINFEDAKTVVEGKNATFGQIEYTASKFAWLIDFTLQKENRTWLIISSKRKRQTEH